MYDYIVVGAGFCGAVIARKIAEDLNKKVLVIDRRTHIAGNAFDEIDKNGILIQRYGPHIFHTNSDGVYEFINKYGKWNEFKLKCEVVMDGISTPSPFNYSTIDSFYSEEEAQILKDNIFKEYNGRDKATIVEMLESSNPVIKKYADMLFEKDYSLYTAKQWGISPKEIDVSVLKRVPVRFDYENMYFDDKYECMPQGGYTEFFRSLLDNENITVKLGEDVLEHIKINENEQKIYWDSKELNIPVIFTGALDELLGYKYGKLPYRSLEFKYETKDIESFQNAPVVAYPQVEGYTRITEFNKLPIQKSNGKTTIAYEYPTQFNEDNNSENERYYPIINDENYNKYNRYLDSVKDINNLFLCGRLADYKYYNMDNAIERALEVYKILVE